MKAPSTEALVEASMEIRAHNAAGWEKLVRAFEDYASKVLALTLSADPSVVMRAQGMAIQAAEIATIMRTSPEIYDAMRQQQMRALNAKRTQPPERRFQPNFPV